MIKRILLITLLPITIVSAQVTIKSVKTFAVGTDISESVIMCATPDLLFFGSNNNNTTEGLEPWISDGSTTGTRMMKNISDSYRHSNPKWFKHALGKVLFVADVFGATSTRTKLFISEGTDAGTVALCDLSYNYPASVSVSNSIFHGKEMNGKYYFSAETDAEEAELWVTDGTPAGTKMLKDIYATTNFASFPKNFEVLDNKLYFTAKNDVYGEELWVSDGTEAGTMLVKDIYPGNKGYVTGQLIAFKGKLYFAAADKDANKGIELWVSDGTAAGTVLLKDINQEYRDASPKEFYVFDDKLYFTATNYLSGAELYVTDGTTNGTVLVQDIYSGTTSSNPSSFVTVGNSLFFVARDATTGYELRKLNAGSQTVELIKDINPGSLNGVHSTFYADSRYNHLSRTALGNNLIFTAVDNTNNYYQVWITDGTSAGTKKLTYNNVPGSNAIGFTVFKNEAYFWGNYYTKYELYKVSGVVSGINENKLEQNKYRMYQQATNLIIKNVEPTSKVTIYTVSGQVLAEKNQENNNTTLQFSGLKAGLYFIKIQYDNNISTQKIIFN
jgi:ELWxxDGT repeat protein